MTVALVRFTPGARTNWHSHAVGQTLHVTEGIGLVAPATARSSACAPATPSTPRRARSTGTAPPPTTSCATSPCSRVSPDGDATTWLEPVTDEEYRAADALRGVAGQPDPDGAHGTSPASTTAPATVTKR